ncbi:MAG: ASKHA domain-containing protein [Armatimonadota bacterium]|nr:ASKHA domain-containing protein [Armatimonadota bacterium]
MSLRSTTKGRLVRVIVQPDNIEIHVPSGSTVAEAALIAGTAVETPCGGMGICGKCKVIVTEGVSAPDASEKRLLDPAELAEGVRLACRSRIQADTVITVPETSRSVVQKILCSGISRQVTPQSNIQKLYAAAPEPTLQDERAEFERIAETLGLRPAELQMDLETARRLSARVREAGYKVTAVVAGSELLSLEAGDTTSSKYGVAFDLGSTTVVGYLIDLNTGHEAGVASTTNPQMAYGDDLISRINFASTEPHGLEYLTRAAIDALNRIIRQLVTAADISPHSIYEATVVGNSCMTHILLGIDPASLGQSPYVPTVCRQMTARAGEIGVKINPRGLIQVLPNVAGFVGSDLVGVLLASMWEDDGRTRLAVDIGTNGEMALRHNGRTLACSAAAGPAFEGARISCGIRGGPGAIDSVRITDEVTISTINNRKPRGICGSGLVDAVAEMLNAGIVDEMGRLLYPDEVTELSPSVRQHLIMGEKGPEFVLADANRSATGKALTLKQRDIRQLQLAKGSIHAAIRTLVKVAGADVSGISELLLAGAFGSYIRKESAVRIGLVPDIPVERITSLGNAAGTGAKLALLSVKERELASHLAETTEHVELANHPDYQNEFMDMMLFPAVISER